jgi:hypothetical protein
MERVYLILLLLAQNEKWELIPNDQYSGPMVLPLGMKHLSDSYEKPFGFNIDLFLLSIQA